MPKSRKLAASVLLFVFLLAVQPRQANAFAPALIAAGALGAAMLTVGALTYYKPAALPSSWSKPAVLDTYGTYGRIAIGAMKQYSQYGKETLVGNYATLKGKISDIQAKFLSDTSLQSMYSAMSKFVLKSSDYDAPSSGMEVGSTFVGSGAYPQTYKVLSASTGPLTTTSNWSGCTSASGSYCTEWSVGTWSGTGNVGTVSIYRISAVSDPPKTAKTTAQILGTNPQLWFPDDVQSDLDAMIAANANGYGVSVVDTSDPGSVNTAPPLVPPAPAVSPIDQEHPTVTGLGSPAVGGFQAGAASASAALAQAQQALSDYKAAHPGATAATDPVLAGLEAQVSSATQELARVQTALDGAKTADEEVYTNPAGETLKRINLQPLTRLIGVMATVPPFSLLGGVEGKLSFLVAEPQAPAFDIALPLGNTVHADLAMFNPVVEVFRYMVEVFLSVGVVFYLVRFWRGVA